MNQYKIKISKSTLIILLMWIFVYAHKHSCLAKEHHQKLTQDIETVTFKNFRIFEIPDTIINADAKALIKKQEAFVKTQLKAVEDKKFDDQEIDKIVENFKDMMKSSEEIIKKYEDDTESKKELENKLNAMLEKIERKYDGIEKKLAECKGYEKLQEKMFQALFSEINLDTNNDIVEEEAGTEATEEEIPAEE